MTDNDDDPLTQAMNDALESPPEALFSPEEREKIESLVEDPHARPGYELLRGALVWNDEIPHDFEPIGFLPSRVDPRNLALLIEFEKAEWFDDLSEGDDGSPERSPQG